MNFYADTGPLFDLGDLCDLCGQSCSILYFPCLPRVPGGSYTQRNLAASSLRSALFDGRLDVSHAATSEISCADICWPVT